MPRLSNATLAQLPDPIARSRYDRTALQPGIVHLGIGAFMRAHLAVATEAAIAGDGERRFGIVGVSMRQPDTRDALAPQDGLYTVAVRDAGANGGIDERFQVIGCVTRLLVAPEQPAAVLEAIAAPAARIVSLTITEKGYGLDPATRKPRLDLPEHAHDISFAVAPRGTAGPRSAAGLIVHGLARRRAAGLPGLTLLSLDNLPSNGSALRALVLAMADAVDPSLARWIEEACSFPCSMVDRIVPRTTDAVRASVARALGVDDAWPVAAEAFFDWAVEDHFVAGRPDWTRQPGVRFVPDAAPWETLKLRMVNGCHSAIAYLGAMAGWNTVDRAVAEPALRRFVDGLMRDELEPTLPALNGFEIDAYRSQLHARWSNPAIAHRTQQIAMDGSQKLPQRLTVPLRDRTAGGKKSPRIALALAAWLHYLRGRDEAGHAYPIDDPMAEELGALCARAAKCADLRDEVAMLTGFRPVFGELAGSASLVEAITPALRSLRERGVAGTLESFA